MVNLACKNYTIAVGRSFDGGSTFNSVAPVVIAFATYGDMVSWGC